MLGALKRNWHKARALGALQTYFHQPLSEPLPPDMDARLKQLSRDEMTRGGTPIDTALRYYAEVAEQVVREGRDLNDIKFGGVLGAMFALRDKMRFYREHHDALIRISNTHHEPSLEQ